MLYVFVLRSCHSSISASEETVSQQPPQRENSFVIGPKCPQYTIGRLNCDYCINDASISRHHASFEIRRENEKGGNYGIYLKDCSKFGTFVNAKKVAKNSKLSLNVGDVIQFANYQTRFKLYKEPLKLCLSNLQKRDPRKQKLQKVCSDNEICLSVQFDHSTHYLVMSCVTATLKVFSALILQRHIVTPEFIFDTVDHETTSAVKPENYQPDISEPIVDKGLVILNLTPLRLNLLSKLTFLFLESSHYELMHNILQFAGAKGVLYQHLSQQEIDTLLEELSQDVIVFVQSSSVLNRENFVRLSSRMSELSLRPINVCEFGLCILYSNRDNYCNPSTAVPKELSGLPTQLIQESCKATTGGVSETQKGDKVEELERNGYNHVEKGKHGIFNCVGTDVNNSKNEVAQKVAENSFCGVDVVDREQRENHNTLRESIRTSKRKLRDAELVVSETDLMEQNRTEKPIKTVKEMATVEQISKKVKLENYDEETASSVAVDGCLSQSLQLLESIVTKGTDGKQSTMNESTVTSQQIVSTNTTLRNNLETNSIATSSRLAETPFAYIRTENVARCVDKQPQHGGTHSTDRLDGNCTLKRELSEGWLAKTKPRGDVTVDRNNENNLTTSVDESIVNRSLMKTKFFKINSTQRPETSRVTSKGYSFDSCKPNFKKFKKVFPKINGKQLNETDFKSLDHSFFLQRKL